MSYDPIMMRRMELQRQIAEAQRGLDTLQLVPTEDEYEDGTIIRAQIRWGSMLSATYVFLKVVHSEDSPETRWYHTGFVKHPHSRDYGNKPYFVGWRELQSWLIDRGRVVESWEPLMSLQRRIVVDVPDDTTAGGTKLQAEHVAGNLWRIS